MSKARTGRTTRMIQEAIKLSKEGYAVYVVFASQDIAKSYEHQYKAECPGISFEHPSSLSNLDLLRMVLRGAHPNVKLLVDHAVIEKVFARGLAMMHRYDLNEPEEEDA